MARSSVRPRLPIRRASSFAGASRCTSRLGRREELVGGPDDRVEQGELAVGGVAAGMVLSVEYRMHLVEPTLLDRGRRVVSDRGMRLEREHGECELAVEREVARRVQERAEKGVAGERLGIGAQPEARGERLDGG
jgi:hypothetical protein